MSREFMDEEPGDLAASAARIPPEVCRSLRTKTAFGTLVGHRPWQLGASSTAVYWCLRTMASAGPDDGLAHPPTCRPGRGCHLGPVE